MLFSSEITDFLLLFVIFLCQFSNFPILFINETFQQQCVQAMAGWVGDNSEVLEELSKLTPLSPDRPFCAYVEGSNRHQYFVSKLQWLLVNCETTTIRQDLPTSCWLPSEWNTAVAATIHSLKTIRDAKNSCPVCRKKFESRMDVYRHIFPR